MNKERKIFVISHDPDAIKKYKNILEDLDLKVVSILEVETEHFNECESQETEYRSALYGLSTCDGVTSLEDTVLTSKIIKVCNLLGIPYLSSHNWIAYLN